MSTTHPNVHPTVAILGQVLERLERSGRPVDPEQYRTLVSRLSAELQQSPRDGALETLLAALPSVAELYENLNYAQAGLCRTPLDTATRAELAARTAIESARSGRGMNVHLKR